MKEGRIAVPSMDEGGMEGQRSGHFGHCDVFKTYDITDQKTLACVGEMIPPPHEPGVLPKWMSENAVDIIIAGGMGIRAQDLFKGFGIQVLTGASPEQTPDELVESYLSGTIVTGDNTCDH